MTGTGDLRAIVHDSSVVLCCGTGGVGKTTTAAALGIAAARAGRRTVVVTVDPARRLATALGLTSLMHEPHAVTGWEDADTTPGGSLDALMLDSKTTFDELVIREAHTPDQAKRILENRFYRNISSALGGTQEYMAIEKLYELHASGRYDVVIVDTPPTRHALDVLDAPARLLRLLENPLFKALMLPSRTPLRLVGNALQSLLRNVARVVGAEVVDDAIAFFRAFEGMESGFRERAHAVETLLKESSTAFVLITTLQRDALTESEYFADRLHELGHAVNGLVINRIHPVFGAEPAATLRRRASHLAEQSGRSDTATDQAVAAGELADLFQVQAGLRAIAEREHNLALELTRFIPEAAKCEIPMFPADVHNLATLGRMAEQLDRSEAPDTTAD